MGYIRAKMNLQQRNKEHLNYWSPLWEKHIEIYHEVYIQCWNEETKQMGELLSLAEKVRREGLVHYFRIALTKENHDFLAHNSIEGKKIKWFLMRFINEDGSEGIEIRDYGAEVIFNQVTTEEAPIFIELFDSSNAEIEYEKDEQDD